MNPLSNPQIGQLADALLACPAISDSQTRNAIVDDLPDFIEDKVKRYPAGRADVISIIKTCMQYEGGIQALLDAVHLYEDDSLPMRQVQEVWQAIQQAPAEPPEPAAPVPWEKLDLPDKPDPQPPPPPPVPLVQLLLGTWQTQTTYPNGMVGIATVQIFPNYTFQMQGTSPMSVTGQFYMQGWWSIDAFNQLLLQGQQSDGINFGPFAGAMRFSEIEQNRLAGAANTGSLLVWQRIG